MDVASYCARLGLDPAEVRNPDLETLTTLQAAHVTTVPFETLAITGDPYGDHDGAGVSLARRDVYEKVVDGRRGGFCYELNGLFAGLLDGLGFEVTSAAGMFVSDGDPRPPANHLVTLVDLDRRYVVEVGMGVPPMRRPLPVDGTPTEDGAGERWRVVDSDRPDVERAVEHRGPGDDEWETWYVYDPTPRDLDYFAATCEFLQSAPESPFTGDPVVSRATDDGYLKLSPGELVRVEDGRRSERAIEAAEFYDLLRGEFGLRYPPGTDGSGGGVDERVDPEG